ncbi:hypothetical protein DFAR_4040010 [Desulfarculales bacterium]
MDASELLDLGLELLQPPWRLVGQRVDTDKQPHKIFLEVVGDRGASTPARSAAGGARLTISTHSPGITAIFSSIIAT